MDSAHQNKAWTKAKDKGAARIAKEKRKPVYINTNTLTIIRLIINRLIDFLKDGCLREDRIILMSSPMFAALATQAIEKAVIEGNAEGVFV